MLKINGNFIKKLFNIKTVSVSNSILCIDGEQINLKEYGQNVTIEITGNVSRLNCNSAIIHGNVTGNVDANDVKCNNIEGDIDCNSLTANDIIGDIDCNIIECNSISGDVDSANIRIKK